jgi:hypothetical protein
MDNLIRLSSVTQVMKARDILKNNGITSKIHRIPAQKGQASCSYGLLINEDINKAVEIILENDIKILGRA